MSTNETNVHSRRSILRKLSLGALAICPICAALPGRALAAAASGGDKPGAIHWGYGGAGAPEKWGSLSADFRACDLGLEQTPIDIKGATRAELGQVQPNFQPMGLRILNNGHTIQVNCDSGSGTDIAGTRFDLLQFHFHHPSEHLLAGARFELECHFVHRNSSGDLAVLGVFIKPGTHNAALQPVFDSMPGREGPEQRVGVQIKPADMLPRDRGYFRYYGSLTTPPCSEGVLWTVYRQPIEASADQIRRFAQLFPVNARPVLPLNRRYLLETN